MPTPTWLSNVKAQLARKKLGYWIRVAVIGALGIALNAYWTKNSPDDLLRLRMWAYQVVSRWTARAPLPADSAVVLISDEDFWKNPRLARRSPIKRDYLGDLITRLCRAHANVVAIDFDMRSPVVDGSVRDHSDYRSETATFVDDVNKAATSGCHIVLPTTLNCSSKPCVLESGVLDGQPFVTKNITRGYLNLPDDTRQVPIRAHLRDGGSAESFTMAIVRARNAQRADALRDSDSFPYGTFMTDAEFRSADSVLMSDAISRMSDDDLENHIHGQTILIGAGWHAYAFGRGDMVDLHRSPLGMTPGVLLHLNYVAALLDSRFAHRVPEWVNLAADVLLVVLVGFAFALEKPRVRWTIFGVATLVLIALQYVAAQNAGVFFECTVVVVLLFLHWLYDEHSTMRERLAELETEEAHRQAAVVKTPPAVVETPKEAK
ncbi:CHASE2 domain-containing protein [Paraburkholderia sp. GAS42]|uniref:CHASE2 domain-containing protein n=1 Tax=Paraburkholderia sp. GAS42 TaxID=3035135 RepID=UPI003D2535F3